MKEKFVADNYTPESEIDILTPEIIQFDDEMVLSFTGDQGIVENKWIGSGNPMIVETASGNVYNYGRAVMSTIVISGRTGVAVTIDDEPEISLGEPWILRATDESGKECIIRTTGVRSVLAQWKIGVKKDARRVDGPSPFNSVRRKLLAAEERMRLNSSRSAGEIFEK